MPADAPPSVPRPLRPRLAWLLYLALTAALYGSGVDHPFTFDDRPYIEHNRQIRTLEGVAYLAFHPLEEGETLRGHLYRPAAALALHLVGRIGGFVPAAYHAANILLATLGAWLLHLLGARLFGPWTGLAAALLFAVHPLHVEVVASAVGLTELLAFALALAALHLALRPGTKNGVVAAGLFLLALLSKETAVVVPALALLAPLVAPRETTGGWRRPLAIFLPPLAAYFALRHHVLGVFLRAPAVEFAFLDNPLCGLPAGERIANALVLLVRYLRLLVLPVGLSADYSYDSLPLAASLTSPTVLGALTLHVGLLALAWSARRRLPALAFGLAVIYLGLLPAGNLLFCGGTIFGERFAYLPSAGAALAAAAVGAAALTRGHLSRRAAGLLLAALLALGAWGTLARLPAWSSDRALFAAVAEELPGNAKAHYNLAVLDLRAGDPGAARRRVERALAIHPAYAAARVLSAEIALAEGRPAAAEETLRAAVADHPGVEDAWVALGALLTRTGRATAAADLYRRGLDRLPLSGRLRYNLALLHLEAGDIDTAEPLLRRALDTFDFPDARYALGHILAARGELDAAVAELRRGLGSELWGTRARHLLAWCELRRQRPRPALEVLAAGEPTPSLDRALLVAAAHRATGDAAAATAALEPFAPLQREHCHHTVFPDLCFEALTAPSPGATDRDG